MRIVKYMVLTLLALAAWGAAMNFGTYTGLLLSPIAPENTSASFIKATQDRLDDQFVGNLAMALIEDGQVSADFYHSIADPVDQYTIFQMASISKWITSWGVFTLVRDGKIDLDAPVETYLSRWQLPDSEYDNSQVTVRNLLCHTSGLVDGLGYAGFTSIDSVQSLEESLTLASDGFWSEGAARVGYEPNSSYKYSGGGYTLLQLIIEEVSDTSFNDYMTQAVFEPLQMNRSSFIWSDNSDLELATFYNSDSTIAPHYRYTALAAASLYTCIADMSLFLQANLSENEVLDQETIAMMTQSHTPEGMREHGLGPAIYAENGDGDRIIGHDGMNRDAINNSARINLKSKDGIIVFQTGHGNFASVMANHWGFWKTGIPNGPVMQANMTKLVILLVAGILIILITSIYTFRHRRQMNHTSMLP